MFGHVLLQVLSETESNELQQLSGAVLQLQHTRLQKFQADLSVENLLETVARASVQ